MKTNKIFGLVMAAALAVGGFAVFSAYAGNASHHQETFRGRFLQRAREKLDLTDDQTAQIKAVIRADKENLTGIRTRMREARVNLRQTIRASDASEASVRTASSKVAAIEAEMAVERMKLFARIAPILTGEQRAKLADMEQHVNEFADSAIARASRELSD